MWTWSKYSPSIRRLPACTGLKPRALVAVYNPTTSRPTAVPNASSAWATASSLERCASAARLAHSSIAVTSVHHVAHAGHTERRLLEAISALLERRVNIENESLDALAQAAAV